ncbi:hypothetical protein B0J12DRAFT_59682 [Macrophomina phaseolina]|uniref:Uncharacterized protein n=1 Tax=Macrophomina phaseolina TaxID=35725 RepID=A0ABQ8FQ22_9PEZI|nr:hypothetical protein B0J12DRAFT_59682 [Macrophomina phaseolina]
MYTRSRRWRTEGEGWGARSLCNVSFFPCPAVLPFSPFRASSMPTLHRSTSGKEMGREISMTDRSRVRSGEVHEQQQQQQQRKASRRRSPVGFSHSSLMSVGRWLAYAFVIATPRTPSPSNMLARHHRGDRSVETEPTGSKGNKKKKKKSFHHHSTDLPHLTVPSPHSFLLGALGHPTRPGSAAAERASWMCSSANTKEIILAGRATTHRRPRTHLRSDDRKLLWDGRCDVPRPPPPPPIHHHALRCARTPPAISGRVCGTGVHRGFFLHPGEG